MANYIDIELEKKVLADLAKGIPKTAIADHYGLHRDTVARIAKKPKKQYYVDESAPRAIVTGHNSPSCEVTRPSPKNEGSFFASELAELVRRHVPSSSHNGNNDDKEVIKSNENKDSIVLVIPDLHCPWEHPQALDFLRAVKARWNPTTIVNLGDEVDFYGMSRFDHDPDVMAPGHELNMAVKHLIPFYREFPNVLICQSNHTHRIHAKAAKAGMPKSSVKSIEEILKTPEGWIYKHCHRVDGVDYKHGTGKSGANAHVNHAKATGRSTAIGHIHAYGGINWLRRGLFAANFSCLIDKKAPCFDYAAEMDDNIVMGCGIVINGVEPHFIPMHVDDDNNWIGRLL